MLGVMIRTIKSKGLVLNKDQMIAVEAGEGELDFARPARVLRDDLPKWGKDKFLPVRIDWDYHILKR